MKTLLTTTNNIPINEFYLHNFAYVKTNEFFTYVLNLSLIRDEDTLIKIDREDILDEVIIKLLNQNGFTSIDQKLIFKEINEKIELLTIGIEEAIKNNEMVIADYGEFVLLA